MKRFDNWCKRMEREGKGDAIILILWTFACMIAALNYYYIVNYII